MAQLCNFSTGEILAANVRYADTWWDRFAGFIPKRSIEPDEGLWFRGCRAIHTLGMRARIDLIFLDRDGRVVRTLNSVARNRPALICPGAEHVVELGEGALDGRDVLVGDRLTLE